MGNVRRISKKYYLRQIVACMLVYFMFFNPVLVFATSNPVQVAGNPIQDVLGAGTDLTKVLMGDSSRAVINWDSLDTLSTQELHFLKTTGNFAVLNRIIKGGATQFDGKLLGERGDIFIVNTRGIIFGPESYIKARTFVASGIDISNRDFMNRDGQFQFERDSSGYDFDDWIGNVTNKGTGGTERGIHAKEVALIGRNVTNKGSIVAEGRDKIVVMAAGDSVFLGRDGSDVIVDVELNFSPFHVVDNGGDVGGGPGTGPGTISAPGGKVILAAGDIYSAAISGVESLRAEAFRNITLEGAVSATGDIALIADEDLQYGGDVTAKGAITAGGNVDIAGNLIELKENVSANGGDLTITGRTSEGLVFDMDMEDNFYEPETYWGKVDVAEGRTLYASQDVKLIDAHGTEQNPAPFDEMDLFGLGSLTIVAEGGSIQTQGPFGEGVKITVKNSSLTMKQADPLNLADYSFGNQNNTDLTLESYNGSVTAVDSSHTQTGENANAADQWLSITATAYADIWLQGHDASLDIKAGALISNATGFDTGNISVTSDNRKVLLTENVSANHGSVAVTAIDSTNGGIDVSGNILASDGITLFGEVTAVKDGLQTFDAGQGTLWAKETLSTITKTGTGKLTLAADTLVNLDGVDGSSGDSVDVQDGALTIDGPVDAEGNLRASGVIQITGPAQLAGDVLSTGSGIIFEDDVTADGVGSQLFDAGSGQLIAENGADIDKNTAGSLTLAGDTGIVLGGNVTGTGMESGDSLIFVNNVTANGTADAEDQRFDAGLGKLDADGSIEKTTDGKLNLGGDEGIELGGNVETHDGDLVFEDAVTANGTGDQRFDADGVGMDLIADDDIIKTTAGNLTLGAGTQPGAQIELAGDVKTSNGHLIFWDKVIANDTTSDQVFDADGVGMDLIADDDIIKVTDGSLTLGAGTQPGAQIELAGDVTTSNGHLIFWDKVIANGSGNQVFDADGVGMDLIADDDIIKTTAGDLTLGAGEQPGAEIYLPGDVTTTDGHLILWDKVIANGSGNQVFDADGVGMDLIADDDIIKTTAGNLTLGAGTQPGAQIELAGDVKTSNGHLIFWDKVIANDTTSDQVFDADGVGMDLIADDDIIKTTAGNLTLGAGTQPDAQIELAGDVKTSNGHLILWDKVIANGSGNQVFDADGVGMDLIADDDIIKTTAGDLTLGAGSGSDAWIDLNGDVRVEDGSLTVWDKFKAFGDLIASEDIMLTDDGYFDGTGSPLDQTVDAQNGTLTAEGWVWKTTAGNLYLLGNNDDPEHNNGKAIDLQYAGCLPAASTALGNLELYAENGDIQISGDLTTFGYSDDGPDICEWYYRDTGGVSVIAENGKIYTAADSPDPEAGDYMLNIGIVGNSDDVTHRMYVNGENHVEIRMGPLGVDLPWGEEGKAAIVVLSREDLIFGPDTMLIAKGTYDSSVVDDRPGVGFLADPLTSIGGIIRDEGDPIDVAVYVGSMGTEEGQGNVHLDGRAIDVAQAGTMVVDAYDTVTFGDFETFNLEGFDGCEDLGCFLIKLAMRFHEDIDFQDLCGALEDYVDQYGWYEGILEDFLNFYFDEGFFFNIDRMEVASRITEWLHQAVGRLPFAGDPAGIAAFEAFIGGDYILRGAGLGNPGIIDGRAWVLEDPISPPPLHTEAGEKVEEEEIGAEGCPALLAAAALELGIAEDELNVFMASAMAAATDIQPCESCARLVDAATILRDEDGSRMAAMIQVFNELAPAGAPFTPEMATSIVTAFAGHVDDGTYYATAIEYIDAFVQYIAVLDTEMGSPVGEGDSVAFVMGKHGAGITESDNANIGTFVATRLEGLQTFGD